MTIPFNIPLHSDKYLYNISDHFNNDISYTKKCIEFMKDKYNFNNVILTTSCTHSLEMMAMILNIGKGDEVIVPSYTFVSSANAFVKFGATIKCVDSNNEHPNIDIENIERHFTQKTKALVVVHYAGQSCNMTKLKNICKNNNIYLLEDAAQAINSYYDNKPLGSFGILSAFSFHSTKNLNCGEGGMLVINDANLIKKAHIVCDKGTNRYEFLNNEVTKYEWVEKGSSYPISEINSAYLYNQLLCIDDITNKRKILWNYYKSNLSFIESNKYGIISRDINNCIGNYHIFYIIFNNPKTLTHIKQLLKNNNIHAFTHYISLHQSKYYKENFELITLPNSEKYTSSLLRLPLYYDLNINDCKCICKFINSYFNNNIIKLDFKTLSEEQINSIISLKSQYWKYEYESQRSWMINNIKDNDINVLLYNDNCQLIGVVAILNRNCMILDSLIVDEKYRCSGFGSIIMKYVMNNIIKDNGFLLCENKNKNFYKKYGWIENNKIKVENKFIKNDLIKMTFNNYLNNVTYL